jgi:hypothetical protein
MPKVIQMATAFCGLKLATETRGASMVKSIATPNVVDLHSR